MSGIVLSSRVLATQTAPAASVDSAAKGMPLGVLARQLEAEAMRRLPLFVRLARILGIRLLDLARILWYAPRLATKVRALAGVSIRRQLADQFSLAFRRGIDPSIYYFLELYQP